VTSYGVHSPYVWQITPAGSTFVEQPPSSVYAFSTKARLARTSALVDYLRFNAAVPLPGMHLQGAPQASAGGGAPGEEVAGYAVASANAWRDLLPAAEFLVERLCADHPRVPIVFAIHGDCYLPASTLADTLLSPDALAVKAACRPHSQCHVLDLRYAFSQDWAEHHVRFEAADGAHWNAYANRLVARTLANYIRGYGLLEGGRSSTAE